MISGMFNIGFLELFIICAIGLLVVGPKQLPEVAGAIGRFLGDLKRTTEDMTHSFLNTKKKTEDFLRHTGEEIEEGIFSNSEKDMQKTTIKNEIGQSDSKLDAKVEFAKSIEKNRESRLAFGKKVSERGVEEDKAHQKPEDKPDGRNAERR